MKGILHMKDDIKEKFDKIYYETYDDILKYIICNTKNFEDINDLIQNVYFDFYKALRKNTEMIDYNSYLIGIAKKKIKSYYRIIYKFKNIVSLNEINIRSNYNLENEFMKKEELKNILRYIGKKEIVVVRCLYLYLYFDMSIKDIAKSLGISESNTKNYIYRTLSECKRKFGR